MRSAAFSTEANDANESSAVLERAAMLALQYRQSLGARPQLAATYAQMIDVFREATPETGTPGGDVIDDLAHMADAGLQAMAGPRFFGWVIGGSHPVGVAADWLTSAWGQNCGNHHGMPAAAAVEEVAAGWLLDLLDLPRSASVGFVTGATVANVVGLAAARSEVLRRVGWNAETDGLFGAPPIDVVIGEDAHSTIFSALQYLGLGRDRVIRVASDEVGRMRPESFQQAVAGSDRPLIAIAQAGQINTGSFDPFSVIVPQVRARHGWLHIDGAFGLWARACPELRRLTHGLDEADSWATDGHKWLQLPYDSGFAIVRHPHAHKTAMSTLASYLPSAEEGERDPSHLVPELSRRARGFAAWAVIRALGREGIAAMVARHCSIARRMADVLAAEPRITIVNTVELNQFIVRFGIEQGDEASDMLTAHVIEQVQADRICFVGGARWRERWVMRISVISFATTERDADASAQAIIAAWRTIEQREGLA